MDFHRAYPIPEVVAQTMLTYTDCINEDIGYSSRSNQYIKDDSKRACSNSFMNFMDRHEVTVALNSRAKSKQEKLGQSVSNIFTQEFPNLIEFSTVAWAGIEPAT